MNREPVYSLGIKETAVIQGTHSIAGPRLRGPAIAVAALISAALLGGCSKTPDSLNPVEWYKGAKDAVAGDGGEGQAAQAANGEQTASGLVADRGKPPPGADKPFPNLAEVPDRPRTISAEERQAVVEGLVSDREQARYSSEVIRRQGAPVQSLGPPRTATSSAAPEPVATIAAAAAAPPPKPEPPATPRPSAAAATPRPSAAAAPPPKPEPLAPRLSIASVPPPPPPPLGQLAEVSPTPPPRAPRLPQFQTTTVAAPAEFETVVVSSAGVVTRGGAPLGAAFSVAPLVGQQALPRPGALPATGSVKVATIQFAVGSAGLDARDRGILRDVSVLHGQRGGTVYVVGHASHRTRSMDPVRHKMVNFQVSADRANRIADELVRQGVPRERITITAKSDSEPVYYEVMPSGEAGNRRAEVFLGL